MLKKMCRNKDTRYQENVGWVWFINRLSGGFFPVLGMDN